MKFKLLLLPALIASITACGGDDKDTTVTPPTKPPVTETNNGELLEPGAKGDVDKLGGATRLKAERTEALKASLSNGKVKNVILIIGDGTSYSEITAARNYEKGAAGYFKGLDVLPFTGSYTTYSVYEKSNKINYVPDSAATATAWATGVKTFNGALGINSHGEAHKSILELAKAQGYATGNVTTSSLQDATPAALFSKIPNRGCTNPTKMEGACAPYAVVNKGLGSIAEQLIVTRPDISLGGGMKDFEKTAQGGSYDGSTLLEQAQKRNFQIVKNSTDLDKITVANDDTPLLGLFSPSTMPVSWSGNDAEVGGNLKAAVQCNKNNPDRPASMPTLKAMTTKAIELLSKNDKGFFLQVESASVDKQNHGANACGQLGETVALDEAVQVALDFAKTNPDTLIIVTGDHSHTSQIISNGSNSPGKTIKLLTKDNQEMTLNYATSVGSQGHTGAQVRTAAYGPHAANVSGLLDQTDLFFIMKNAFGFK